jgi:hypothetical protein
MPAGLREAGPYRRRIGILPLAASSVGCEGIRTAAPLKGDLAAASQRAGACNHQHHAEKSCDLTYEQSKSHKPTLHHKHRGASTPIDVFMPHPTSRSFQ